MSVPRLSRKHAPPPLPAIPSACLLGRMALRCAAARATGQAKQVRIRGQQRRVRQAAVKTLCDRPERGPAPELLHVPGARQGHSGGRGGGKLSWACRPSSLPAPPQSLGLWAHERNGASGTAALQSRPEQRHLPGPCFSSRPPSLRAPPSPLSSWTPRTPPAALQLRQAPGECC